MHWSASGTRASDEFLISLAPAADVSPLKNTAYTELPTHDPISDVTKKDLAWHHKSIGENAIHLIPGVLILCALTLWINCNQAMQLKSYFKCASLPCLAFLSIMEL
jgi:hypothetical protein